MERFGVIVQHPKDLCAASVVCLNGSGAYMAVGAFSYSQARGDCEIFVPSAFSKSLALWSVSCHGDDLPN